LTVAAQYPPRPQTTVPGRGRASAAASTAASTPTVGSASVSVQRSTRLDRREREREARGKRVPSDTHPDTVPSITPYDVYKCSQTRMKSYVRLPDEYPYVALCQNPRIMNTGVPSIAPGSLINIA
ncbi:hypothetical protein KIPB_015465, partial [Kipferlia bialata]